MHKSGQIGHLPYVDFYLACTSTVRCQIAATDRARLHALAPRTGGDGAAVLRPLQQPQPPPLPTEEAAMTACSSSAMATIWRRVTRKARRPRSACATVPMLAAVLRVDSRWAPSSRTRRATPISMCTHYASDTGVEAWRMVSWVSARRGCGGRGACEHSERRAAMNQGRLGSRARSLPSTACRRSCSSRRLLAACAWVIWVARAGEEGLEIQCGWCGHGAGQTACDELARAARGEGPTARPAGTPCQTV